MKMIKTLWISLSKMLLVLAIYLFAGMDAAQAQGCSQPSNLVSNVLSFSKVSLRWSAISGAVNYTLQYRLDNSGAWIDGGTTTRTSTMLTNLLPGRVYIWRVKASCSTYSSVATFNSGGGISGNVDCSAPSNLVHSVAGTDSVSLGWSSIVGALNYSVQYRAANTTTWLNTGSVVGTNLALGSLASGTTYEWRVKASCSVYSSTTTFTLGTATGGGGTGGGGTGGGNTGGSTSCSAPSNTNTGVVTSTTAQISWEPQGGALDYTIQYRLASSNTYVTAGTVTYASATITGLQAGREYVWRVKANCSPYGSDVQFSTPFTAASALASSVNPSVSQTQLRLFPNPVTKNALHIQTEEQTGQVFILNGTGQVVLNEIITDQLQTLDVSQLKNGLYFVRVLQTNGKSNTQKLVITH